MPRLFSTLLVLGLLAWAGFASPAQAQQFYGPPPGNQNLGNFFYYPYYYYPHSYWPTQGPTWPERTGQPYMRPPAYMAYPPFKEPHWYYMWWQPQKYHRGFHFWLDQF